MTRTTLAPFDLSAATRVGPRTFRKQILPIGTINYKGQRIKFDKKYLTDLADSFAKGAYDQVPLVAADGQNQHNEDPTRFNGELVDVELTNDGLDGVFKTTARGAKLINDNPKIGVSARIREGLEKSDGRKFPRALRHVLLTMDPRVTGMTPWQAVDLSEDDNTDKVVDLTAAEFEGRKTVPTKTKIAGKSTAANKDGVLDLSDLDEKGLDALLSDDDVTPDDVEDSDETDVGNTGDESAETGDQADDADEDEDDEDDEDDTSLSEPATPVKKAKTKSKARRQTDLANDVLGQDDRDEIQRMRVDLAAERWQNSKREYARAGVPPFLLDLAEPILASPDEVTLDLANSDDEVSATETVRAMLEGVKGLIDLTPDIGHGIDLSEDESKAANDLLSQWDNEYGTV